MDQSWIRIMRSRKSALNLIRYCVDYVHIDESADTEEINTIKPLFRTGREDAVTTNKETSEWLWHYFRTMMSLHLLTGLFIKTKQINKQSKL